MDGTAGPFTIAGPWPAPRSPSGDGERTSRRPGWPRSAEGPDPRLSIPPLPPRLVSRPRLIDALDAAVAGAALTLVTAGPGSGKSALLSEWARRRPAPPAWLALTRADNDPSRFWSLFIKALRHSRPLPLPTAWSGEGVSGMLDTLLGEEQPEAPPAVVVLDDAHLLTSGSVLEGLDRLVQRWSPRVRLVMAGRSVPLLPLHRYRLAGQVAELRAVDLAMTPDEARACSPRTG